VGDLVHLRRFTADDAPAFVATIDADVVTESHWDPVLRRSLLRAVRTNTLHSTYAICPQGTSRIVGAISARPRAGHRPMDRRAMEFGVWVGRPHRGNGYTGDALQTLASMVRSDHFG
jgi:RimJ/RimL family protein N-acetyltransferase